MKRIHHTMLTTCTENAHIIVHMIQLQKVNTREKTLGKISKPKKSKAKDGISRVESFLRLFSQSTKDINKI